MLHTSEWHEQDRLHT